MPIHYKVLQEGHFIHAIAEAPVSADEFVAYETGHATDERIKPPVKELFEIKPGALDQIDQAAFARILDARRQSESKPVLHRCALVVSYQDAHAWDLAKFYESMTTLHYPESVIVFGDDKLAGIWLEVDQ